MPQQGNPEMTFDLQTGRWNFGLLTHTGIAEFRANVIHPPGQDAPVVWIQSLGSSHKVQSELMISFSCQNNVIIQVRVIGYLIQ